MTRCWAAGPLYLPLPTYKLTDYHCCHLFFGAAAAVVAAAQCNCE